VRKRHATSTSSIVLRNSSSTPSKGPPSSSKKPRPVSVDSGRKGKILSVDKMESRVPNLGFTENEESQVVTKDEVVLENLGESMAVDVVKSVLADITEGRETEHIVLVLLIAILLLFLINAE